MQHRIGAGRHTNTFGRSATAMQAVGRPPMRRPSVSSRTRWPRGWRHATFLRCCVPHWTNFRMSNCEEGAEVVSIEPARGRLLLADGRALTFDRMILAAGVESFGFIDGLTQPRRSPSGGAVKGQAALFRADVDQGLADHLYRRALYRPARKPTRWRSAARARSRFDDPNFTDRQLDALLARAIDSRARFA